MMFARLSRSPFVQFARAAARLGIGAGLLALAACASPLSHVYTLGDSDATATVRTRQLPRC